MKETIQMKISLQQNPHCQVEDNKMNRTLYHQAGNSIPVAIFEAMFEVMLPKFFDFNVSLDDTRKEGGQDGET